uniref:Uncharacterized protein n=1 Tax=Picea glauca TaxID=3330 RepID=A0A124GNZ0_PICGL|nr:hypothetical protein ABT39_MTgene171 [Picea glauca]
MMLIPMMLCHNEANSPPKAVLIQLIYVLMLLIYVLMLLT